MAQFPALPLWTDAYLGDTNHLTTLEHGTYLLLLITAWRSKDYTLPNDDKLLCRYARLSPAQWKRLKPIILPFFDIENDRLIQRRLIDEINLVKQRSKSASNNARARWLKNKGNGDTPASNPQCEPNATTTTPTTTPIKKEITKVIPKEKMKNGTRLSVDWVLSDECKKYALDDHWTDAEIQKETENFIDYFTNGKGRRETRLSWLKSWQTWVRNNYNKNGNGSGAPTAVLLTAEERKGIFT